MNWSDFPHEADIGLRGSGPTKAEAFEAIGLALTAVVTDPEKVTASDRIEIRCNGPDDENLLVDWLNSLIYEMAVRKMLFRDFRVSIVDGKLTAEVRGEKVDRDRHEPAVEVKGATYTALNVAETDDGWSAQCVVDV